MKKIRNTILICLSAVLFFPIITTGQTIDCSSNYEKALLLYNQGIADSALSVLKPCLENKKAMAGVSKETGANIFRLAALSSIMKGDPVKAEEYVKQLLKYQPDYKNKLRDDDLMEFRLMINKNYSQPALRIGVIGGMNTPFVKVEKKYSDYPTSAGGDYSLGKTYGSQFGVAGEKTLTKNISLEVAAVMTQILFKYTIRGQLNTHYQYNQSLKYAEIPVLIRYYFTNSSFKPYLQGGVTGRISLKNIEKSGVYGRYFFTKSSNSDKILTTFLTDIDQVGLVLGGGAGYDVKKFIISLDFRYNYSFKSSSRISKFDTITGYDDISSDEKFHYTDDINLIDFKNFQISIGILYNLKYKVF